MSEIPEQSNPRCLVCASGGVRKEVGKEARAGGREDGGGEARAHSTKCLIAHKNAATIKIIHNAIYINLVSFSFSSFRFRFPFRFPLRFIPFISLFIWYFVAISLRLLIGTLCGCAFSEQSEEWKRERERGGSYLACYVTRNSLSPLWGVSTHSLSQGRSSLLFALTRNRLGNELLGLLPPIPRPFRLDPTRPWA